MPGNNIGHLLRLTSWGESHGPAIGGVLDGLPPGISLNIEQIQEALDRRRPGAAGTLTSPRNEQDQIQILSGFFDGKTLGTPLSFMIHNTDQKSSDYDAYKNVYRPGHADYTYDKKYGHVDHRGGGRASARETAVRVAAGEIARQVLCLLIPSYHCRAAVVQIGQEKLTAPWDGSAYSSNKLFCPDTDLIEKWSAYLQSIKDQGRSIGALIEVQAHGIPAGLGEPVYDKLDADIAKALMSINAAKAVEIGDGFDAVTADVGFDEMGSGTTFSSNRAGGILGGISSGQPIVCRVAFKPTSSTNQPRQTVDKDGKPQSISITGRHDPCVGIRAVPIVEAMLHLTLLDHLLRWQGQCGGINNAKNNS